VYEEAKTVFFPLIYRLIPNNVFIKDMGQPLMAVPTVVCHPGFLCFSDKISARYHCNIPRDPIVFVSCVYQSSLK